VAGTRAGAGLRACARAGLRANAMVGHMAGAGAGNRGKEPCYSRDKGQGRAQGRGRLQDKCKGRKQGQGAAMTRSNIFLCRSRVVIKDVTKVRKHSRKVLTQDVTKVRKHSCKEGSQEDIEAAQGGPGEPILESPQATFLIQQLCLKSFHDWSAVDLHSLGISHMCFSA